MENHHFRLLPLATIHEQSVMSLYPHQPPFVLNPILQGFAPSSILLMELPKDFFKLPANAQALFSTDRQKRAKRDLPNPAPMPIVRSNLLKDVYEKADSLWDKYYDEIYELKQPNSWFDLHQFFDAFDLYTDGPDFCFMLIVHLAERIKEQRWETHFLIDKFARDWAAEMGPDLPYLPQLEHGYDITRNHIDFHPVHLASYRWQEIDLLRNAVNFHLIEYQRRRLIEEAYWRPLHSGRQYRNVDIQAHTLPSRYDQHLDQRSAFQHPFHQPQACDAFVDTHRHSKESQGFMPNSNPLPTEHRGRGWSSGGRDSRQHGRTLVSSPPQGVYILSNNKQRNFPDPIYDSCAPGYKTTGRNQQGSSGIQNNHITNATGHKKHVYPNVHALEGQRNRSAEQPSTYAPMVQSDPEVVWYHHHNGNLVNVYDGSNKEYDYNKQYERTLSVTNFPESWIDDHQLKSLMTQCGQVVAVTYVYHNPRVAMVEFKKPESVLPAIQKFNGYHVAPGLNLIVEYPRKSRSTSSASASSFGLSYAAPHRNSTRDRRPVAPFYAHSRTISGVSDGLQLHSTADYWNHRPYFIDRKQGPLSSVENLRSVARGKQDKGGNESLSIRNNRKENFPAKSSQTAKGNKSKKKEGLKQNTSTQLTPAGSPLRSRSEIHVNGATENKRRPHSETGTFRFNQKVISHVDTPDIASHINNGLKESPSSDRVKTKSNDQIIANRGNQPKRSKKGVSKSDTSYSDSVNVSFCTDISDTNPRIESLFTSDSMASTKNTSFSTISSKKSTIVLSEVNAVSKAPKSRKSYKANQKTTGQKQSRVSKNESSSVTSKISFDTTATNTQTSSMDTQLPSHSKKDDGSSPTNSTSISQTDEVKTLSSKGSSGNNSIKSDATTPDVGVPEAIKPGIQGKTPDSVNTNLNDQTVWQGLRPVKLHLPAMENRKPASVPTTVERTATTTTEKKVRSAAIVAVPRNFLPRIQPTIVDSLDISQDAEFIDLGSETWPFVKSCKPLWRYK